MIDFGKLKSIRLSKNMTPKELSKLSGVSVSHIGRIERGQRKPSYTIAQKLIVGLGLERLSGLDEELVSKVKGLKLEFGDNTQSELLIRIPNRNKGVSYEVETMNSEFTSLCPLNLSQPDYATIYIKYRPKDWLVELKSLKFYLVSYRQVAAFHEEVPTTILKDLVALLEPREMVVTGYFTIRGGIETTVRATWGEKEGVG